MVKNLVKRTVIVLGFAFGACSPSPSKSGPAAAAPAAANLHGTSTHHATSSSSSGDAGLGNINDLFAKISGGASGGASGAGASGGSDGSQAAPVDPNAILWSARFGEPYLSFPLYDPHTSYLTQDDMAAGKNNTQTSDTYDCPGDSFLIGLKSLYNKEQGDRLMRAYCQFFEDGAGHPLRKKNCQTMTPAAFEAGVDSKPDYTFTCPTGKLLAGFQSNWDGNKNDRRYLFECCEASTEDGKALDFATMTDPVTNTQIPNCERVGNSGMQNTLSSNSLLGELDAKCAGGNPDMSSGGLTPMPSVINNISNSYLEHASPDGVPQNDRMWSLECCAIGITK